VEDQSARPLQLLSLITQSKLDVLIISRVSQFCENWQIHCEVTEQMRAGVNEDAANYSSYRSEIIVVAQGIFSDSRYFNYAKSVRLKFQPLIQVM